MTISELTGYDFKEFFMGSFFYYLEAFRGDPQRPVHVLFLHIHTENHI